MTIKSTESKEASFVFKIAALIIIMAGVVYAKSIITPFLLALFISIICAQPMSWLEKKGMPKWLALLVVILGLILLFSGFSFLMGRTLSSFSNNYTKYESTFSDMSNSFIQYLAEKGIIIPPDKVASIIQPAKILEFTADAVNELFRVVGHTFLIFLIILFTLMEVGSFPIKAKAMLSGSDYSVTYFSTIIQNIRHDLWIKSLICLTVGILIYISLLIIGIDYPLLWAIIAGLLSYIPHIGSLIAAIPAVLFASVQLGLGGALWTLGAFMVIYNVIGNFFEPRIMGKGLSLSTLIVFLSLLFWGFLLGTVGMFLSVPITMTIKIILEHNEKTKWLAILLGTPAEAKIYLKQKKAASDVGL